MVDNNIKGVKMNRNNQHLILDNTINKMKVNGTGHGLTYLLRVLKLVDNGARLTIEQELEVDRCIKREYDNLERGIIAAGTDSKEVVGLVLLIVVAVCVGALVGNIDDKIGRFTTLALLGTLGFMQHTRHKQLKAASVAYYKSALEGWVEKYETHKEYWHDLRTVY